MHSQCAIAWLAHRGFAFALISFGLLVAPPATPIHARMAEEGRLINNDHLGAGSFLETIFSTAASATKSFGAICF
jgi:hypothetical protein